MNKHIVVLSQYFYPENFRINDICNEFIKLGYKITVITGIPNYPKGKFFKGYGYFRKRKDKYKDINIVRLCILPRLNNPVFLILNYLSFVISGWFWAKFTRIRADLIFNFEVSPMTQALPAVWFSKRLKIPFVLYVQDLWPENLEIIGNVKNKFILSKVKKMVKYIYDNSTKILVTSLSFKQSILELGLKENQVIVWHQYAEDFYKPQKDKQLKQDSEVLKIVFTGNIGESQGLDILAKSAIVLKNNGFIDRIKFILIGDGRYKSELIRTIEESNVTEMFNFIGIRPATEIPDLLARHDVAFVSFKENELFNKTIPAKLQSYLACGLPILAAASGETEKIIKKANCGKTSSPGDVMGLVRNIISYLNTSEMEFKLLKNNSLKYSNENFKKEKLMNEIYNIFKEVM